jgi:hypothetical protein
MKRFTLSALLTVFWFSLSAQSGERTIVKTTRVTMTGAELQKVFGNVKITDPKFYDGTGKIIDSAEAKRLLRTYDYVLGWKRNDQGEYKKLLTKINPEREAISDSISKITYRPKSQRLWEGTTLDLKPLNKSIDRKSMEGKAVILIFWCNGCFAGSTPDAYSAINEVLAMYFNPDKLEILTITHHPMDVAKEVLSKNPIVNTQHIVDAGDVTNIYETDNRPVIVLTDKNHKIVYSITNNMMMTPRILYKTLKKIL